MSGVQIGAAVAAVLVAVLGFILDRSDKRKAAEREIKPIPDNPDALRRTLDRVQRIKTGTDCDFQP